MQIREGVKIVVVATAYDRSLAIIRHDERQWRCFDLPGVNRDSIPCRHVQEHATEPVISNGCEHVRHRTAEGLSYFDAESFDNSRTASCTVVINCAGKMMVEFFSTEISAIVWRVRS